MATNQNDRQPAPDRQPSEAPIRESHDYSRENNPLTAPVYQIPSPPPMPPRPDSDKK